MIVRKILSLSQICSKIKDTITFPNLKGVSIIYYYLLFYVLLKNISLIWRRHHYRWRAAKFRPMLSARGLWAGRDLYRATPAVTRGLGLSGLIRRTAPFSRLLRHTRGCGGPILTRVLTGRELQRGSSTVSVQTKMVCDSLCYTYIYMYICNCFLLHNTVTSNAYLSPHRYICYVTV
jgi:hypothetical protein